MHTWVRFNGTPRHGYPCRSRMLDTGSQNSVHSPPLFPLNLTMNTYERYDRDETVSAPARAVEDRHAISFALLLNAAPRTAFVSGTSKASFSKVPSLCTFTLYAQIWGFGANNVKETTLTSAKHRWTRYACDNTRIRHVSETLARYTGCQVSLTVRIGSYILAGWYLTRNTLVSLHSCTWDRGTKSALRNDI